jgi:hypothetical protein
VPWREFNWYPRCPDGEVYEEEFNPTPRYCGHNLEPRWHPDYDDERDREPKRGKPGVSFTKFQAGLTTGAEVETDHQILIDEVDGLQRSPLMAGGAQIVLCSLHLHTTPPADERWAFQKLWQEKGPAAIETQLSSLQEDPSWTTPHVQFRNTSLDIIEITSGVIPEDSMVSVSHMGTNQLIPDVITITPQQGILEQIHNNVHNSNASRVEAGISQTTVVTNVQIPSASQAEADNMHPTVENIHVTVLMNREVSQIKNTGQDAHQIVAREVQDPHGPPNQGSSGIAPSGSPLQIDRTIQRPS